jgi:hypothetical protein
MTRRPWSLVCPCYRTLSRKASTYVAALHPFCCARARIDTARAHLTGRLTSGLASVGPRGAAAPPDDDSGRGERTPPRKGGRQSQRGDARCELHRQQQQYRHHAESARKGVGRRRTEFESLRGPTREQDLLQEMQDRAFFVVFVFVFVFVFFFSRPLTLIYLCDLWNVGACADAQLHRPLPGDPSRNGETRARPHTGKLSRPLHQARGAHRRPLRPMHRAAARGAAPCQESAQVERARRSAKRAQRPSRIARSSFQDAERRHQFHDPPKLHPIDLGHRPVVLRPSRREEAVHRQVAARSVPPHPAIGCSYVLHTTHRHHHHPCE